MNRDLGEAIQLAREAAGLKRGSVRLPIICGVGAVAAAVVVLTFLLNGESAERAKPEAAKEVGPGNSMHVTSLNINQFGGHESVSAIVMAWNNSEVRDIRVHWDWQGHAVIIELK